MSGKPSDRFVTFLAVLPILAGSLVLLTLLFLPNRTELTDPRAARLAQALFGWLMNFRDWFLPSLRSLWYLWVPGLLAAYAAWLAVLRFGLQIWNDRIRPLFLPLGDEDAEDEHTPARAVDFWELLTRLPPDRKDEYVLGEFHDGTILTVNEKLRTTHAHVLGATGSGKTQSVLLPLAMQDILHGKAVIVLDAKGSADTVGAFLSMSLRANRLADYKPFTLPYPKKSFSYNPIYPIVGDPLSAAQMVFSTFTIEHEYYRGQSQLMFQNLVAACAATGLPFNLGRDLDLALTDGGARDRLFDLVTERARSIHADDPDYDVVREGERAMRAIKNQFARLGPKADEVFTGLDFQLRRFDHPLLNAYNPDIKLAEDVKNGKILYFELPANMYAGLASAIGVIVLQQLQQISAMRQVDRRKWGSGYVGVFADEFFNFKYPDFVKSVDMSRDANFQFLLAHQTMAQLEAESPEFSKGVDGSTLLKVYFKVRDHQIAENIARTQGTRAQSFNTNKKVEGALLTQMKTAEASERIVEQFDLHPNVLKKLATRGQAVVVWEDRWSVVNLPLFRVPEIPEGADLTLYRNKAVPGLDLAAAEPRKDAPVVVVGNQD